MKRTLIAIMLILPIALIAQNKSFTLNGKVGNLNKPAKAYLSYRATNVNVLDSTVITNGQFEFKGTINDPVQATLIVNATGAGLRSRSSQFLSFYLESGAIKLSSPDSIANAKITGSKVNADNDKLKLAEAPLDLKLKAFMAESRAVPADKKNDEAINAALEKKYDAITEERKQVLLNFIKSNPNSFVSLAALKNYGGSVPDYAEVSPLFNALSPELKNTATAKAYSANLEKLKATAIGEIAPAFTQNDPDGKAISLSDLKGKYVLIDFWASWCGPCRRENPNVVLAYAKYHDKGFEILGVSLDSKKDAWIKAISDDKLIWKQVSDVKGWENQVAALYAVRAIPQNFLIDPSGKIVAKNLRGEALENKLAEILK